MDDFNRRVIDACEREEKNLVSTVTAIKPKTGKSAKIIFGESMSAIKRNVLNSLLSEIVPVNFIDACKNLGWQPTQNHDGSDKPPLQKNYKVAIIDRLMAVAKANNWHLIYDASLFYIYTGGFWVSLDKDELKNFLKDVAIKQCYPEINARDNQFINQLYDQALQDGFFVEKPLRKQSMINLNNGTLVLDAKGVRLKDFDYRDFLTHQLPFDYAEEETNPRFISYLDTVLPDKDTQRTLQEVCGYLFTKGLKLEKIVFLYGTGANGKSVLFEVLNGLMGDENISQYSLESLTDSSGYYRAKIKDIILNYGTDIKLSRIDAGMFKTLASGEPIEARLPYCEPFTMSDYAKLIFNVNRLDDANIEHTHGFYRRLLLIPFNKVIKDEDQDRRLHDKILENKAGVLNWIIAGANHVIRNEDIFISTECKEFKSRFIKETDSAALFIDDYGYKRSCNITRLKTLYEEYEVFCDDDGYKALGKKNFKKRLEALEYVCVNDNNHNPAFEIAKSASYSI